MMLVAPGCVVARYCFDDKDCEKDQRCNEQGRCESTATKTDSFVPPDGRVPIRCPLPCMVNVDDLFCIDIYEASRPDATETAEGTSSTRAVCKEGVLPWQGVDLATARAACEAAGKYLCKLDDWVIACQGPQRTVYPYGDEYDPVICNGIDSYCTCDTGPCSSASPCPYPHCFQVCGASFRVDPTGARPGCTNSWGTFDISGNVWELTDTNDGLLHFRGGAYNCSNSAALHRCDHDGTWGPSARGFRCCADGVPIDVDAGPPPDQGASDAGKDSAPVDAPKPDLLPSQDQDQHSCLPPTHPTERRA
jgi:hypothetical protein